MHGANRLASNSLLEGMVFGFRVVEAVERGRGGPEATGAMRSVLDGDGGHAIGGRTVASPVPHQAVPWSPAAGPEASSEARTRLQHAMTAGAGVVRSAGSLAATQAVVADVRRGLGAVRSLADAELHDLVDVAEALLVAAQVREESRGAHTREDHPDRDPAFLVRLVLS